MPKKRSDKILFGIVAILVLFGFFMLASAFLGPAAKKAENFYSALSRQALIGLFGGGILFLITSFIPYTYWRKIALPLFLTSFFLTILVFEPHIGFEHANAKRWISIGPLFFQPSEFLKFGFLVYLSSWLVARKEDVTSFKHGLFPFLIIISFVGFILVMEPNISTLLIIGFTAVCLFFIAGGRFKHIAVATIIATVILFLVVEMGPAHLKKRVNAFLNKDSDPQGQNYQLKQAEIAFGSGGIFGKGFGMSIQKFNYLPEPTGDSIFAIIGEEFGFIGTIGLIGLFLLFMQRGFLIATRAPDNFGRLLGSGIVIMVIIQSFMNMAAMTGIFPLTGLPLLFISQGGSALALVLAEIGVLVNISKYQKI